MCDVFTRQIVTSNVVGVAEKERRQHQLYVFAGLTRVQELV